MDRKQILEARESEGAKEASRLNADEPSFLDQIDGLLDVSAGEVIGGVALALIGAKPLSLGKAKPKKRGFMHKGKAQVQR